MKIDSTEFQMKGFICDMRLALGVVSVFLVELKDMGEI